MADAGLDEYGAALRVAAVLDEIGIDYTLGGSLAGNELTRANFLNALSIARPDFRLHCGP